MKLDDRNIPTVEQDSIWSQGGGRGYRLESIRDINDVLTAQLVKRFHYEDGPTDQVLLPVARLLAEWTRDDWNYPEAARTA